MKGQQDKEITNSSHIIHKEKLMEKYLIKKKDTGKIA
jgi:hypothetical protein